MNITFRLPRRRDSKILAFADVTVVEGIIVKGFRVVNGSKGVFAAVPSKQFTAEDGSPRFANQVVFANLEIREKFLNEIITDFNHWRMANADMEMGTEVVGETPF